MRICDEIIVTTEIEEKSEAFFGCLVTKRAGCDWLAWYSEDKWYMAASDQGLTNRMVMMMKPNQLKRDEDVSYEVEIDG